MLNQSSTQPESKLSAIIRLLRWDKPAGRLILMIPALWALFLAAQGQPPLPLLGAIVLGTLATSAAGCVINDLWDKDIDPQVDRTRTRPLAARVLTIQVGIVVAIIAFLCAGAIALYLNPLSFWLSVAAVPIIIAYPLAKRFFPIPQLVLSIAWGFAVLISWSATVPHLDQATWLLWAATVFWTLGFDTVYAMSDRDDDLKIGINSSAIFFGQSAPLAVGIFFLLTTSFLTALGLNLQLHFSFWLALLSALIFWLWQYWQLRKPDLPKPVYGDIFRQNVAIGFILLTGMIFSYLFPNQIFQLF